MKNLFKIVIILCYFTLNSLGQEVFKPNKFKINVKNMNQLKSIYKYDLSHIEIKKGEKIASIGAGNGSKEVQIAIMNEGIDWTLQEIDSVSLNPKSFKNVVESFEKIIQKPIHEKFSIVIGNLEKTNLLYDAYDRVLLLNVYHEITDKQRFMTEIHQVLKEKGRVVVMESMARKIGQRHQGCNDLKLWEPDFLTEMEKFNFKLLNRNRPREKFFDTFFIFEKNNLKTAF